LVVAKNGNDTTGNPYLTVEAAVAAATAGKTIWIMPGIYDLDAGITVPDDVCIRGLNVQTCTLQMLDVTVTTTLLTMGVRSRVEDLTLKLTTSDSDIDLTGVEFDRTTTSDAKLRTCVITVDNSAVAYTGVSNVYGILCSGP
jgi:hypothetical protein